MKTWMFGIAVFLFDCDKWPLSCALLQRWLLCWEVLLRIVKKLIECKKIDLEFSSKIAFYWKLNFKRNKENSRSNIYGLIPLFNRKKLSYFWGQNWLRLRSDRSAILVEFKAKKAVWVEGGGWSFEKINC